MGNQVWNQLLKHLEEVHHYLFMAQLHFSIMDQFTFAIQTLEHAQNKTFYFKSEVSVHFMYKTLFRF